MNSHSLVFVVLCGLGGLRGTPRWERRYDIGFGRACLRRGCGVEVGGGRVDQGAKPEPVKNRRSFGGPGTPHSECAGYAALGWVDGWMNGWGNWMRGRGYVGDGVA